MERNRIGAARSYPGGRAVEPGHPCAPIRGDCERDRNYRKAHPRLAPVVRRKPSAGVDTGVGPIGATALVAEVGDWTAFSSGRSLAAWIGLVPRQHSTGGKERLGRISKQGNRHLRWLLVAGAMAVIRYARQHGTKRLWLLRLMGRRRVKVAAVALANKIARMAWAMMVHGKRFSEPKLLPTAAA
jgi:transposase